MLTVNTVCKFRYFNINTYIIQTNEMNERMKESNERLNQFYPNKCWVKFISCNNLLNKARLVVITIQYPLHIFWQYEGQFQ